MGSSPPHGGLPEQPPRRWPKTLRPSAREPLLDSKASCLVRWVITCVRATMLTAPLGPAAKLDEDVRADVLPGDKAEVIRCRLQEEGRRVAMVGDGIDDAGPAQAWTSGRPGSGCTEVTMASADITISGSGTGAACSGLVAGPSGPSRADPLSGLRRNVGGIPVAAGEQPTVSSRAPPNPDDRFLAAMAMSLVPWRPTPQTRGPAPG